MPLDAPTPTLLPFTMRVSLEVSSNFIDLDGLACLRCGSPFPKLDFGQSRTCPPVMDVRRQTSLPH